MLLVIVRHGDALSDQENPARPLSPAGQEEIKRLAGFMKSAGVSVDVIYHSPKQRALETARVLRGVINPRAECREMPGLLPMDPTDEAVYATEGFDQDTMIVSHLPFVSKLTARLVLNDERLALTAFTTGTAVILQNIEKQGWLIRGVISPDMLPESYV